MVLAVDRRTFAAIFAALLVIVAGCAGVLDEDPEPEEIVDRMSDRHEEIEDIHGIQTVEIETTHGVDRTTYEYWERPGEAYRYEVLEADQSSFDTEGDVAVRTDGTTYTYDASENTYYEFDVGEADENAVDDGATEDDLAGYETELIENLLDAYDVSLEGTETVADRSTYVVNATPESEDAIFENATLWVDQEYWYLLDYEIAMGVMGETITMSVEHEEIAFNEGIDDEQFEFDPPEDAEHGGDGLGLDEDDGFDDGFGFGDTERFDTVEAADEETPFGLVAPTLPDEYELVDVEVTEYDDETEARITYSADLSVVQFIVSDEPPLFAPGETVTVGDREGTLLEVGEFASLTWTCDGVAFELLGEFDEDELIEIAETVPC